MRFNLTKSSLSPEVKTTLLVGLIRGLFKIGSCILEPVMLNLNLKQDGNISDEKRQIMVTQQAIRQGVTFFTDLSAFLGTALASLSVLKRTKNPALWSAVAGMAGEEFVGNILLRPFLMTKVTSWWDRRTASKQPVNLRPIQKTTLLMPKPGFAAANGYVYSPSSIYPNYPTYLYGNRVISNRSPSSPF